jgi:hypothetical protein
MAKNGSLDGSDQATGEKIGRQIGILEGKNFADCASAQLNAILFCEKLNNYLVEILNLIKWQMGSTQKI